MKVVIGIIPVMLMVLFAMRLVKDAAGEIPNLRHSELDEDENIRQDVHQDEEAGGSSSRSSRDSRDSANHFDDTLSDDPPLDYPTYTKIPQTGFSCRGKVNWHYYADVEADCQVFHVCETQYSKISFLCPDGSVFNQRHLVCDWWYNFDCQDAESLYLLKDDYNNDPFLVVQHLDNADEQEDEDRRGFDLSLAQSGGNTDPSKSKKASPEKLGNTTSSATTTPASKDERRRSRVRN